MRLLLVLVIISTVNAFTDKTNVINLLFHREFKISSNETKFTIEIERIQTILVNNNYPQKLVDEELINL